MSTNRLYDVIVIGCGASGIAALSRLYRSEFSILGLEASSRIGGRIRSMQYGNGHIDFGAEFCHGQENNIVYTLAKDHNVIGEPKEDFELDIVFSDGTYSSKELRNQIDGIMKEVSVLAKEEMKNSPDTVGTLLTKKFWELLPKYDKIDENLGRRVLELFEKFENSIDGSDNWHESSAKGLLEYWECDGYLLCYWKNNGYQSILDILLKKYPNPSEALPIDILCNKKVEKISWNDLNIKVECSDGTCYYSKQIIITVSLGVLKENCTCLFTPPLPRSKINAIEGLAFGTVNKIFLKYEKPWWPLETQIFGFIWNDEEKNKVPPKDKWIIDVYGFHAPFSNGSVLCFWISGPSSRYMETLPLDYVKKCIDGLVKQFFSRTFKISNSIDIMRSSWYSNPLTRGSYSFRSMKTEKLQTSQTQLSSPLYDFNNKLKICFAGEATSTHYYSTVHGAIEAGFREADRLIQYRKTQNSVSNYNVEYSSNNSEKIQKEYDVVIIGAGIAGLAAAKTLLENKIENFTILEAQDYVGGRIKSKAYDGGFIEYGAQWIHGDCNDLKQFVEEFKLTSNITSTEGEGIYLRNDGFEYDPKLWQDVDKVVCSILNKCKDFCKDDIKHEISIGKFLCSEFEQYVNALAISEEDKQLWNEIFEWHLRFQEIDNSCFSLNDLSVDAWGLYGEDEQSHLNLSNGYYSIIETILKIVSPEKVQINKPVQKIIWECKNKKDFKSIIISDDGDAISAKYIICTISLGCLKAQLNNMFDPYLPQKTVDSIKHLGYDSIGKIFIQFEENWWGDAKGFQITWINKDKKNSFAGQDDWLKCLSGFDLLTTGPPNTLLGWVNHKGVKIIEKLSTEVIKNDCSHFFKLISKRQSLPEIKMVERSLWDSNKYIRGSYCYITRACDEHNVGPHTLSQPIKNNSGKPVIFFAGEACHSSFFSTTHGAFDTGYQQALQVRQFLLSEKNIVNE